MNRQQLPATLATALAHHQRGEAEAAARLYAQACAAAPDVFDCWHLAGALAFQQGRLEEAVELLSRAHRIDPQSAPCRLFLGMALADGGRYGEAEAHLRAALEKVPDQPEAWLNLARAAGALGRPAAEAIRCLRRAAELQPDRAETHERLGELLATTAGLAAAEPHFRRATELQPGLACAWTNLGLALLETPGRFREAAACLDRALEAEPRNVEALAGRALGRLRAYRAEDAACDYRAALALDPGNVRLLSAWAMLTNYLPGQTREAVFAAHREFGRLVDRPPPAALDRKAEPDRRLRVGFVSPDLRAHPVAFFLEPLLRHLDRGAFEIVLFPHQPGADGVSERLRRLAGGWHNLNGLGDEAAESLIRSEAIDILVDLAGHSSGNRLPLLARRPAPVQVAYLGYPHTTGLAAMDYRFTDALADPPGEAEAFATERLVRFAPTAWAFAPSADGLPEAREPAAGDAPIVFGSFNNFLKVTDELLGVWARLLDAVPRARLVLKSLYFGEPEVAEAARARLRGAGVEPGRVELLPPRPTLQAHLAAFGRVDIALDTYPYHGTTTTCEALWMGVPVVTLAGDRHAARVGVSLLTAAGHPEWIARTSDDYVRIAAGLAADSGRRTQLRSGLRREMAASALLDHAGQAGRFGRALRACWTDFCSGHLPERS